MTPEAITLVQTSLAHVVPSANSAAALFYGRLFELNPSLRELFTGDMGEQGRKPMTMLGIAVKGLGRPNEIVPVVQKLDARHGAYGVKDKHYTTVGAALLWTLGQGLGERFAPEIRAAWANASALLSDTMRAAGATNNTVA